MLWNSFNFKQDQIFLTEMSLLFMLTYIFEKDIFHL